MDDRVFFKLEEMVDLLQIKSLVFEKLPLRNFKNLNLPRSLPNLKKIQIRGCPLSSLEGLPLELPNLESISIGNLPNLQNLKGFPKILPKFWTFAINNLPELRSLEGLPPELPKLSRISLYDLPNLHSFKGLPQNLPHFSHIKIQDVNLHTFKHLPEKVSPYHFGFSIFNYLHPIKEPFLFDLPIKTPFSGFYIQDCIIKDFSFISHYSIDDLKKSEFGFERCIFRSFEGFPILPENANLKDLFDRYDKDFKIYEPFLSIGMGCKIRSFSGLSFPFLQYIFPYLISPNFFDFAPHGKKLLGDVIDWEYLKLENELSPQNPVLQQISQNIYLETSNWLHLEYLPQLYNYFKIPLLNLTHQYISNPTSLPPDQIERLVHEADHNIRKILENSLPPKNSVILRISQKFSFNARNNLKIFK